MPNPSRYPTLPSPGQAGRLLHWLDAYIASHVGEAIDDALEAALKRHRDALRPRPLVPLGPSLDALIAGHSVCRVAFTPQTLFRPLRLVVDPGCAPSFSIAGIASGVFIHSAGWGKVPATVFLPPQLEPAAAALPEELARVFNNLEGAADVGPGQSLVVDVVNEAPDARAFRACIFGEPV